MSTLESFKIQAQYNLWMNKHFYGICDSLNDVDRDISNYVNGLTEKVVEKPITFTSHVQKAHRKFILRVCLLHFFHHQTHHRGQLSTLISQLGIDIGVTDLLWMPGLERTEEIDSAK